MVAPRTNCDAQQLHKLLSDELSEFEEARATDHVGRCSTCRMRLEELAASGDCWREAGEQLRGSHWNQDGTLWLTTTDFGERAPGPPDSSQPSIDFLEPSDNPAMLGRLGTYEILEVLGSGGFGIVLKGYDRELNRYVAVKVLAPHLAHNAAARKRFAREAQSAAAVAHPHVVAIHAVDATGKFPYLVMPLIAGESLQDRLDREGPLEIKEILRIGLQVAQGLAAAHAQGVVHRDVKPSNILLERGVDRVMLTDFGLARAMDDAAMTRSTVIAGTPQYMSPEQAQGNAIDHRTDLFSLGSVMYAMCAGHPPFRAETLMGVLRRITDGSPRDVREVNTDVPEWLGAIIARLHAIDVADRFPSAADLAGLLEGCLAHLQQPTGTPLPDMPGLRRPVRLVQSGWRWVATSTASAIAIATGLLLFPPWSADAPESSSATSSSSTKAVESAAAATSNAPVAANAAGPLDWRDGLEQEFVELEAGLRDFEWNLQRN